MATLHMNVVVAALVSYRWRVLVSGSGTRIHRTITTKMKLTGRGKMAHGWVMHPAQRRHLSGREKEKFVLLLVRRRPEDQSWSGGERELALGSAKPNSARSGRDISIQVDIDEVQIGRKMQ